MLVLAAILVTVPLMAQQPQYNSGANYVAPVPQQNWAPQQNQAYYPAYGTMPNATLQPCSPGTGHNGSILRNMKEATADKLDRHPCCGYGKSHNDNGVWGTRATCVFAFGSACDFFDEPCRTAPPETCWQKMSRMFGGSSGKDCSNCK